MPQSPAVPYINIQDQKTQNTGGGTATSGSFQTRTLNTVVSDTAGIASLASNQITLPPGTYRVYIGAPACFVTGHQARLQSISDGATLLTGTSEYTNNTGSAAINTRSIITGRIVLSSTKVIEVQHRVVVTSSTTGFGFQANLSTEVYTVVELWKEG